MTAGQAPARPFGAAPLRRPSSVRRTTTIDTSWPDGFGAPMRMVARGRDLVTDAEGRADAIAEQELVILASARREILAIGSTPPLAGAETLVGARAGGASRLALAEALGDRRGTLAYQLLDDFAGASLVAGWAWSRWTEDFAAALRRAGAQANAGRRGAMVGVCTGFAPGSSALTDDGGADHAAQSATPVGPLDHPDDPEGWHRMTTQDGAPGMRRARRLDLWREGPDLCADVGFQDSATAPAGGRIAVHEYHMTAMIDPVRMTLKAIAADPHILPYRECPGAVSNIQRLIGQGVHTLRDAVLSTLAGTLGCTHLNDVLRSLADVPTLCAALEDAA